jgi:Domain of unknown function (DUF1835)
MSIHVLAGDALAANFKNAGIEGEIIVCRECLIEGDLQAESLEDFWRVRAAFIHKTYDADENSYLENVAGEFEKLLRQAEKNAVNLWFEYELFCQINMWFCLSLLKDAKTEIYRVAPVVRSEKDLWKGFGNLSADDLRTCFEQKIKFEEADVLLGKDLWKAYAEKDFERLKELSLTNSKCFPKLAEVCEAEIEKQFRPKQTLEKIVAGGEKDFNKIFESFSFTEGVYGFGDLQVKRILESDN